MAYTKRDIVTAAFANIGMASYQFDMQPEQINAVLQALDQMMATWDGQGVRVAYPLPSGPNNSDLDEALNVPDRALEAMTMGLAIRIAPQFGVTPSPDLRNVANQAYKMLVRHASEPIEMTVNSLAIPAGAGNRRLRSINDPFLRPAKDPLAVGRDNDLTLE